MTFFHRRNKKSFLTVGVFVLVLSFFFIDPKGVYSYDYPSYCCTAPGGIPCGGYCVDRDWECYSNKLPECNPSTTGGWMCIDHKCVHDSVSGVVPDICPSGVCILPTSTPIPTATPTLCTLLLGPSNLQPGTTACGATSTNFLWSAVSGATGYGVRVDDLSNSWNGDCVNPNPGDSCSTQTGTTYTRSTIPGHSYNWWVHTINICGSWGNPTYRYATVPVCPTSTVAPPYPPYCCTAPGGIPCGGGCVDKDWECYSNKLPECNPSTEGGWMCKDHKCVHESTNNVVPDICPSGVCILPTSTPIPTATPTPTIPKPSCGSVVCSHDGTQATINYTPVPGYDVVIRLDNQSAFCAGNDGDYTGWLCGDEGDQWVCAQGEVTSHTVGVTPGVAYNYSVQNSDQYCKIVPNDPVYQVACGEFVCEDPNFSLKKLPSTTFSYSDNCGNYKGGCPLKAMTAPNSTTQSQTANDFFLKEVNNGYNGNVVFEYWNGGETVNVKYCDPDKKSFTKPDGCWIDNTHNTQRHRIAATVTYDGMGNSYRNTLSYDTNLPMAYVKQYAESYTKDTCPCDTAEEWEFWCDNPYLLYDNVCGPDCSLVKQTDFGCCDYSYYDRYLCTSTLLACGAEDGKTNTMCRCNCNDDQIIVGFSGFEFLGYPKVTSTAYEKNSTSALASKTETNFYTKLETDTCFKPSPLRGTAYYSKTYNVDDQTKYVESRSKYKVRFGAMLDSGYTEVVDDQLNAYCANYIPESTIPTQSVTLVMQTDGISKNSGLCTRSETVYGTDRFALPLKSVNYGKVSCTDYKVDDTSDIKRIGYTNYTPADIINWILPLANESWISDSDTGEKFNHSRVYYDYKEFDVTPTKGQVTRTESLIDGTVVSYSKIGYDTTYPWQVKTTTDALDHVTTISYDSVFHMYPVSVTNALGHTVRTEYDFNEDLASHPNRGNKLGVVTSVIDPNGSVTYNVYDSFGRLTKTYLPGKIPGTDDRPSLFSNYYYFNEFDYPLSLCTEANNCKVGLGVGNTPKMMVYSASRMDNDGLIGTVSGSHTYYNGFGQNIQKRSVWYEGDGASAGVDIAGEGKRDLISSTVYGAYGVEYQSDIYTDDPYSPYPVPVFCTSDCPVTTENLNITSYDTTNILSPDSTVNKIQYLYDGFARNTKVIYPDQTAEETVYDLGGDPLKTKVLDKNCTDGDVYTPCSEAVSVSDAFGQTIQTIVTDTTDSREYITTNIYHPVLGVITDTKDTLGTLVNKIEYDKLGRKFKMWNIDTGPAMTGDENSWRYVYDALGNLTTQTNPKGIISTLSYDALNRIKSNAVGGKTLLINAYDDCGTGIENDIGRLCKTESYGLTGSVENKLLQTVGFLYDNRGRIIKKTVTLSNMPDSVINDQPFVTEIGYDEGGRVLSTKINGVPDLSVSEETLRPQYNTSFVSGTATDREIAMYGKNTFYNKDGQVVSSSMGNNVSASFVYDSDDKRLQNTLVAGINLTPSDILNLSYEYDPNGSIKRIIDNNSDRTSGYELNQEFTYDALNRLINVTDSYSADYDYDEIGNIKSKDEAGNYISYTYGNSESGYYHRPETITIASSSGTFAYDVLGNMMSDYKNSYQYDENDRLVKVIVPEPTATPVSTPALPSITPTPYRIPGDANNDGVVDDLDFLIWYDNYDTTVSDGSDLGDFNSDTLVDGVDYALWLKNFSFSLTPILTETPIVSVVPTATPMPTVIPTAPRWRN